MSSVNPFEPPRAAVADVGGRQGYQEVRLWSARGRIGRLRYLAYVVGGYFLFAVAVALMTAWGPVRSGALSALAPMIALLVPYLVFVVILGIQRCHDLDMTGWATIGTLVPILGILFGLYFLFAPGTRGENRYGLPPPPNTLGVKLLAMVLPGIVIVGIVAAVALPAYSDYVKRARAVEQQQAPR